MNNEDDNNELVSPSSARRKGTPSFKINAGSKDPQDDLDRQALEQGFQDLGHPSELEYGVTDHFRYPR
jgi:hypothetical protein